MFIVPKPSKSLTTRTITTPRQITSGYGSLSRYGSAMFVQQTIRGTIRVGTCAFAGIDAVRIVPKAVLVNRGTQVTRILGTVGDHWI